MRKNQLFHFTQLFADIKSMLTWNAIFEHDLHFLMVLQKYIEPQ
jgi:hypothetical protein